MSSRKRYHTVAEVIAWLQQQPQDAYVHAYEGEITGIVLDTTPEVYLECWSDGASYAPKEA